MSKPTIITFSGKAQHGKTTSANILGGILKKQNKRVLFASYADYLKYIARQYYDWNGEKDEKGRTLLQELGTEKTRIRFPDFWVDNVISLAKIFENDYDYVIIDDCRFPNEISRWKEEGYNILSFWVNRPNFDNKLTEEQKNHPSETSLIGYNFLSEIVAETLVKLENEIEKRIDLVI